ncbi:MAG: hypothetical protein HC900_00025 [Methylacidiphilales bacterium]|nr:hypothetical protein [Candidatus Methylacidiphilales bacterium]
MTDPAHVLFPNDAPAAQAAPGPAGKAGPGQGDAKPPAPLPAILRPMPLGPSSGTSPAPTMPRRAT